METPLSEFRIVERGSGSSVWKLRLWPDRLSFQHPTGSPQVDVPRSQTSKMLQVINGLFLSQMLSLKDEKTRLFKLDPPAFKAVRDWMGPPTMTDLKLALKRMLGWTITIGILLIIISMPLPGDPETGLEPIEMNMMTAGLGTALILLGVVARIAPGRIFFLMEALLLAVVLAENIRWIIEGGGLFWLVAIVAPASLIYTCIQEYRRFATMKPEVEETEA